MNKEELKNIVSEILGNSDDSTFSKFIEKIASSIESNQALKLNGIGHFQIKKEPLSRMERKVEGNISEKQILLFLPEGDSNEENILSFEIDNLSEKTSEFSESVFDVSINKPTIISEPDIEVTDEENIIGDEALLNSISEFIESGEVIEGYELLNEVKTSTAPIDEDGKNENEEIIIDDIVVDSNDDDFTEAEINKEFMNDDFEDETIDDDFDITTSNVEVEIPNEDAIATEVEISEAKEDEDKDENSELNEEDRNPFDELDDYIKDDTDEVAQEIVDAEPDTTDELKSDTQSVDEQELNENFNETGKQKSNEWYKKPILYIATFSLVVALVIAYIFLPTSDEAIIGDASSSSEISYADSSKENSDLIDSVATDESKLKDLADKNNAEQTVDDKLAEIRKTEETISVVKKNANKESTLPTKMENTPTGLYRDLKNDKSVTERIYFSGSFYTVQSSSWKSTTIAEREVKKLKKRGFDAFIYKVFIASKNGTWNRVRIGYFNTQKEAEQFLKKNKI